MGVKKLLYLNLMKILDKYNITNQQFAKNVGFAQSTLSLKLTGVYDFKIAEMLEIQKYIKKLTGENYTLDYLFAKE